MNMKWQTTIRTRGRVLLPKELRDRKGWPPGTAFKVEECEEGVFLRYVDEGAGPRKAAMYRRKGGSKKAGGQKRNYLFRRLDRSRA